MSKNFNDLLSKLKVAETKKLSLRQYKGNFNIFCSVGTFFQG